MSYNIGVTVKQVQIEKDQPVQEADMPTCILGPLFQVVDNVIVEDEVLDPIGQTIQTYSWPSLKIGAEVDLDGTRNGLIDSQRKTLAEYPPAFKLVDGVVEHDVVDSAVVDLGLDEFSLITEEAVSGLSRMTTTMFVTHVNDEAFLFKPDGGLGIVKPGDRMQLSTGEATAKSVSDTRIYIEESTLTPFNSAVSGFGGVEVFPYSGAPGRVTVTGDPSDFSSVVIGDPAITGTVISPDFKNIAADIAALGGVTVELENVAFVSSISIESVQDYVVRVENVTESTFHFCRITDLDSAAQTMTLEEAYTGVDVDSGSAAVGNNVNVTIYKSQEGVVESVSADGSELVVIVPTPVFESNTFVNICNMAEAGIDIYPTFEIKASYRALRKDLAGEIMRAGTLSELLDQLDEVKTHPADELGFAVHLTQQAQPNERQVFFIPVDTFTAGETTGYTLALEQAKLTDVYNLVGLSRAAKTPLEAHILDQSDETEQHWRRGFFLEPMPMGEVESQTGVISAGQGFKVIRDDNVNFVTGEDVKAGTKVVVTFPEIFAGEYTALGTTTDSDLALDGDPWEEIKEFPAASMDVITAQGVHQFREATLKNGHFAHVEAGDYVEATLDFGGGMGTYRLKVVRVEADGKGFDVVDELPGEQEILSTVTATDISVIRTWTGVNYYIDPLTRSEQVDALIARKSQNNRRFTTGFEQSPLIQIGTTDVGDPIMAYLNPYLTLAAVAAKRSGLRAHDPVTNLNLGGGIEKCKYAYRYFEKRDLNRLAENGYLIISQTTANTVPKIRDMLTSASHTGLVNTEEMVVANLDWQAKTLVATYSIPDGVAPPRRSGRLLGRRVMNLDSLIQKWQGEERLRAGSRVIEVEEDPNNARKTNISYLAICPTAEKEIEITQFQTV